MIARWFTVLAAMGLAFPSWLIAEDSLTPYAEGAVPQTVIELWEDVDARKDALETEVVEEWDEDGVVCRYVIFKVGTFKGAEARIAAFYTFPKGMKKGPAFVWAHGGGQRADRERGTYFAKQGYATVDINWGGREMVEGIKPNTDWGRVDPSQGPRFYPGALRQGTKLNLLPDEHTIDPVVSPRNGNWFLLTYAARRAITFLEQQPEVDPERIGFTGYSMGGNITSYVAIDPRLKAAVPMVGGGGYITHEIPGMPLRNREAPYRGHVELFVNTMESQSYYPHVKAPVLMLSASDDFHAVFDSVYRSLATMPSAQWRSSMKMHYSHHLGPGQWILMNLWFDKYLKGESVEIPQTAVTSLDTTSREGVATFSVTPDAVEQLQGLDIYYSYDPNAQARFWKQATEVVREAGEWKVDLPLHEGLPLFVFANATYPLAEEREAFGGDFTSTFTMTSHEEVHQPAEVTIENLKALATSDEMLPSFEVGWGESHGGGLLTYKFRDPEMQLPGLDRGLRLKLEGVDERTGVRFRATKNKYIPGVREPTESYSANVLIQPGTTEVVVGVSDFVNGEKQAMKDWENIATLSLDLIRQGRPLRLKGHPMLQSLEWVDVEP